MDHARAVTESEVSQAYQAASEGRYDLIKADWLRSPGNIAEMKRLDLRYGRAIYWKPAWSFVGIAGPVMQGGFRVKRQRIETDEDFSLSGIKGIDDALGRVQYDVRDVTALCPVKTTQKALAVAKPILHELDYDMKITRVTAEKAGDEWRVECDGVKNGEPQTRFLILSNQGEAVEHVRARLADYPPGTEPNQN
jgi:hypothetical protein